ncbi:uncharacterized protein [Antedon mediterranea]|uniref:uncharacterized protein n=1 Tax=Antedon mediterranea TaxID=105859 RepID=UPI003AF68DBD
MTNLNSNTDAFRPTNIVTTNSLFTRPLLEDDVIRVEQRQDDVSYWDAGSILCIVGPFIALFVIIIIISLINVRLSKNKSSIYPHIKMKTTDMTSYEMYKPTKDQSKIELYSPPSQRNVVITVESKESHRKTIKTKKISSTSYIKNNDNERILVKTSKSAPTLFGTPLPGDGIPASFSTLKQISWKSLDSEVCSCHTESNTSLARSTNSRNSLILPEIKCCHCRLRELHN